MKKLIALSMVAVIGSFALSGCLLVNPDFIVACHGFNFTADYGETTVINFGGDREEVRYQARDGNGTILFDDWTVRSSIGNSISGINETWMQFTTLPEANPITVEIYGNAGGDLAERTVWYSETYICRELDGPMVNNGMIQINATQAQPVYESAGGGVVRIGVDELWLPNDADGNGYDTYLIQDTEVIDGRTWVAITLGTESAYGNVWVPLDQVTLLRIDSSLSQ